MVRYVSYSSENDKFIYNSNIKTIIYFLGNVLCLVGAVDAYEHAGGVPDHNNAGSGRPAVQLLPPLVRRNLSRIRAFVHRVPVPGAQTSAHRTHLRNP